MHLSWPQLCAANESGAYSYMGCMAMLTNVDQRKWRQIRTSAVSIPHHCVASLRHYLRHGSCRPDQCRSPCALSWRHQTSGSVRRTSTSASARCTSPWGRRSRSPTAPSYRRSLDSVAFPMWVRRHRESTLFFCLRLPRVNSAVTAQNDEFKGSVHCSYSRLLNVKT